MGDDTDDTMGILFCSVCNEEVGPSVACECYCYCCYRSRIYCGNCLDRLFKAGEDVDIPGNVVYTKMCTSCWGWGKIAPSCYYSLNKMSGSLYEMVFTVSNRPF